MLRSVRLIPLLGLVLAATLACPAADAAPDMAGAHCMSVTLEPVAGRPGWFVATPASPSHARQFPVRPAGDTAPDFVFDASGTAWDADGRLETSPDTLEVPIGTRVRWHRVSGLHTITDGLGADDPAAGTRFDYLLDAVHPDFDSTFVNPDTVNFFCAFHEPAMRGVLIVSANASVPPEGPPPTLAFMRSPWPNPSRGVIAFSLGLPTEARVTVEVLDLAGRRVALLYRDALAPGEHPFHWRGVDASGQRLAAGTYLVRVTDGQRVTARRFALIH